MSTSILTENKPNKNYINNTYFRKLKHTKITYKNQYL